MSRKFTAPAMRSADEGAQPGVQLYQEHAPAIFAYLRLRAATPEDAEDLLLEVFVAALENGELLATRDSPTQRAWLRSVAAHKLADHYRRDHRRPLAPLEEVMESLYADDTHSPEGLTLRREEADQVRTLLQQLPNSQRQIMYLRFVYGLTCAEIAVALSKKEGAVRKLLWRALNLVRKRYAEE